VLDEREPRATARVAGACRQCGATAASVLDDRRGGPARAWRLHRRGAALQRAARHRSVHVRGAARPALHRRAAGQRAQGRQGRHLPAAREEAAGRVRPVRVAGEHGDGSGGRRHARRVLFGDGEARGAADRGSPSSRCSSPSCRSTPTTPTCPRASPRCGPRPKPSNQRLLDEAAGAGYARSEQEIQKEIRSRRADPRAGEEPRRRVRAGDEPGRGARRSDSAADGAGVRTSSSSTCRDVGPAERSHRAVPHALADRRYHGAEVDKDGRAYVHAPGARCR